VTEFCEAIQPGDARMKTCLYRHKTADGFSPECAESITTAVEGTEQDIRLDWRLVQYCRRDAQALCATEIETYLPEGGLDSKEPASSANTGYVIQCLKDHRDDLQGRPCIKEIIRVEETQAGDADADAVLSRACKRDVQRFCADVEAGEGRVHACLRAAINQGSQNAGADDGQGVSAACRAAEFSEELTEAKDVLLNPQVREMCGPSIEALCGDIPDHANEGELLACLLENNGVDEMSVSCAMSLNQFELLAAEDLRFDPQLWMSCKMAALRLCPDARERFAANTYNHGAVRTCLKEHFDEIQAPRCKTEAEKMIAGMEEHIAEDVTTKDACAVDRARFCADVPDEEGQVHECLRQHLKELSNACRKAEHTGAVIEAENVDLNPRLKRVCAKAVKALCMDVEEADRFECLVTKAHEPGENEQYFTSRCQTALAKEQRLQSTDIHLNAAMSEYCGADLTEFCSDVAEDQGHGERIQCLVSNYGSLNDDRCTHEVLMHMIARSNDIRFDARAMEACSRDMQQFCTDAEPGKGRVHECLRAKMATEDELDPACSAVETEIMAAEALDARINPSVARFCSGAINHYCEGVDYGDARVLKCLKEHSSGSAMDEQCSTVIEGMAIEAEVMSEAQADTPGLRGTDTSDSSFMQLSGVLALLSVAALIVVLLGFLYVAFKRMEKMHHKGKGYSVVRVSRSLEA